METVVIDGVAIDSETGEILEWPEGLGDQMEYLAMRIAMSTLAIKGHEEAIAHWKRAAGRLLAQQGARSVATDWGTLSWRGRVDRKVDPAAFANWAHEAEMPASDIIRVLVEAAGSLNADVVEKAGAGEIVERIERGPWVQMDKPRTPAPAIQVRG